MGHWELLVGAPEVTHSHTRDHLASDFTLHNQRDPGTSGISLQHAQLLSSPQQPAVQLVQETALMGACRLEV